MKVAVIGSRSFNNYNVMLKRLEQFPISKVISGGAKGADALAEQYAKEKHLPIQIIKPDWNKYGTSAGIIRNKEIVNLSELLIAFWDGESRGTKFTINYAIQTKKDYHIFWEWNTED